MMTELYVRATNFLSGLKQDNRGVTAIEYGLIAVAMAVLLAVVLGSTGFVGSLETAFGTVSDNINTANGTTSSGSGGSGDSIGLLNICSHAHHLRCNLRK